MNWWTNRHNQIMLALALLLIILTARLFTLSVIQEPQWVEAARSISIRSLSESAPRGDIYDRYGRLLAGSKPSFAVEFSGQDLDNAEINRQAAELVSILDSNGDRLNDTLPITICSNGSFAYTYRQNIESWLRSQDLPVTLTAAQAFAEIRQRNDIGASLDVFQAQEVLQANFGIYPPISVRKMKYLDDINLESFLDRYKLSNKTPADKAFKKLRAHFEIDPALPDAQARKILVIRNELAAQGYMSYIPAVIAENLSKKTIVTLAERSFRLPAVNVRARSVRYYPNGESAAHVMGHLGRISESEKAEYKEKGYNASDMIGKDGIEKAFENLLRGRDGVRNVEVNAMGEMTREISSTKAQAGKDIYLTIDLELQKTAEAALRQALEKIRSGGTFVSEYGNFSYGRAYPNANVGAVVAIDIKTGDVLAMASYPAFDPNLFVSGISNQDWQALQAKNPRDPLSPVPLLNVATRTAVQPGSTFKMVTATAALASGLDPNKKLRDGGAVKVGNRTFGCIVWNMNGSTHGYLNLYEAMEVSCNYYFFDLAAGRDFAKNVPLDLDSDMSIEKITHYAQQYGLGKPTGIEIPETVVPAPSAERKLNGLKTMLRNVLIGRAELYFTPQLVADKKELREQIDTIVSWMSENPSRKEIQDRLAKLDVKPEMIVKVGDLCKFDYFGQAAWTLGDELNISIGQGENAYTTLQMANYVATIGNRGLFNETKLLRAVQGSGAVARPAARQMDIEPAHLDDIMEGMHRVATGLGGSARKVYAGFPVAVGAKTGTAERAGRVNPPDEIAYLKQHLNRINSNLSWDQVEKEMKRLLKEYPEVYATSDNAARQAVLNLSRGKVTIESIDRFKSTYDNFSWFVSLAPMDAPQIAVAVMLVQGGTGSYAGPVAKEVIGKYLELDQTYEPYSLQTEMVR